jgi:endonuclease/exonuclease/phosphatase family metal-dependent hydrolase
LIEITPRRVIGSAFAPTRYAILPSPWPSLPEVISIQDDCALAVHAHSRAAPTLTVPGPPVALKLDVVLVMVIAQRGFEEGPVTLVTSVVAELPQPAAITAAAQTNGRGPRTCTLIGMHFAHQPRIVLRNRPTVVLGVLLPTLSVLGACVSNAALVQGAVSSPCAATTGTVNWFRIPTGDERRRSDEWCAAVGPPAIETARPKGPTDNRLTIVSWNVHVGGGNVSALLTDLQMGRLTGGRRVHTFVLLLQEVYRSGTEVPSFLHQGARFARGVRPGGSKRLDITATARTFGLSLFYVPSMRNGPPAVSDEDRGNAILSTLPLDDFTALELPLEHQRRVVVAATVRDEGSHWRLRLVSAHFTNTVGHHLWLASEYGRLRQARALAAALDQNVPTILGGDLNTWFGYHDGAYRELARHFPNPRPSDRRPTFGIMRLDHMLYRLPDGWLATVRRGESRYGSDHYPLIAELTVP